MRQLTWFEDHVLYAVESERGEVKHLSTRRKREQLFIPGVAASERGPSPNLYAPHGNFVRGGRVACIGVVGQKQSLLGKLPKKRIEESAGKLNPSG